MNRAEFMSRLAALLQDVPSAEREEAIQYYNDYFDDAGEGNEQGVIAALGSPEELAKSIKAGLADGGNGGEFTESGFQGYEQKNKNQVMPTGQSGDGARAEGFQGNAFGQQGAGAANAYGAYGQQGEGAANAGGGYGQQESGGGKQPRRQMSGGQIALIVVLAVLTSPIWIGVLAGIFGGAVGILGGLLGIFIAFLVVGVVLTVVGIALVIAGIVAVFAAPLGGLTLAGGGLIMTAVGLMFVWLMVLVVGTAIPALIRGIVNLCSRLFHRGGTGIEK